MSRMLPVPATTTDSFFMRFVSPFLVRKAKFLSLLLFKRTGVRHNKKRDQENLGLESTAPSGIGRGHDIGEPAFGERLVAFHSGIGQAANTFQLGEPELAELIRAS